MLPSLTSKSRRRAACAGVLAALCSVMPGSPARADIDIQINGVDGELRRNVLAYLSLERYKGRDDLDANLVERLQERAVREAAAALRPFGYYEAKVEASVEKIDETRWRARLQIDTGIPVMMQDVILRVEGPASNILRFKSYCAIRPCASASDSIMQPTTPSKILCAELPLHSASSKRS